MTDNAWLLGMTTYAEQSYFEEYARSMYSGNGAIVDLGCWLGSTTIALAKGLAENPSPEARSRTVHAYDQFLWEQWMDDCVCGTEIEGKYKPNESFLDEFHKRTAPWADRIQVHAGDLCHIGWGGAPIELLLIDAMKSWDLANGILKGFFPSLMPNTSYVLHQDFAHYYTSWIHLIQYRLRDCFRFVTAVPHSSTFVFTYVKPLPRELLTASYEPSLFSDKEVDLAFEYSLSLTSDREAQAAIAAAKIMHWIHLTDMKKARMELDKVLAQGFPLVKDLQLVQEKLNQSIS